MERNDISFSYVTYAPIEGLIPQTGKQKIEHLIREGHNLVNDIKSNVQYVWVQNKLGPAGKLLVVFIYASSEELCLCRIHPESCAGDTIFGTNKKKGFLHWHFLMATEIISMELGILYQMHKNEYSISCSETFYQYFGVLQLPPGLVL